MKNNSKEIILEFNLPEFKKEDIKVNISKNSLIIKAKTKSKKRIQKKDFFHSESSSNVFNYATTLPIIIPDKAKIEFKSGKLKIILPKK